MKTKRILSFFLCFVMLFTAFPFAQTAAAEGENPIKELRLPKEITLYKDALHKNDSVELSVEAIGEEEVLAPTGTGDISWRVLDESVVSKEKKTDTVIILKAENIGITYVYAEIKDLQSNDIVEPAVCKVTVRKSLQAHIGYIETVLEEELPSNIDDKEPKYSVSSLTLLKETFSSIFDYFGFENEEPSLKKQVKKIIELFEGLEDTVENYKLVEDWGSDMIAAVMNVVKSPLAPKYDSEYWSQWNSAYDKYLAVLSDIYDEVYLEETAKPVNDVVDEFYATEWIYNDSCKEKLDTLAQRLEEALAALKKRTTKIEINAEDHTIRRDYGSEPFRLTCTVDGDEEVTWTSSNSRIASVDNGLVTIITALPEGVEYVEITASSGGESDTCRLYINNPIASIEAEEGIVVSMDAPKLLEVEVTASCKGYPVTQELEFISSNEKVLTIDDTGLITPVNPGTCEVTIGVKGRKEFKPFVCYVTVKEDTKVTSVKPMSVTHYLTVNTESIITLRVAPRNAANRNIRWASSDESVVTVTGRPVSESSDNVTAVLTGISEGKATITYETTDGSDIKGSFEVTVNPLVEKVVLDKKEIYTYIKSNDTVKINATCYPANAGNMLLDWESSDEEVATVTDGVIKAQSAGECWIVARTKDGSGVTASAKVIVLGSALTLRFGSVPARINTGEKLELKCTAVTRKGEYDNVCTWSVSDTTLATIDDKGVLIAKLPGTVTVTADYFGDMSETRTITIYAPLEDITLPSSLTLSVGTSKSLIPTFVPNYASNKKVTWSTTDRSVVAVKADGTIEAVGVGTANITVRSDEGGYIAVCKVTVYKPVSGIKLNKSSYTLTMGSAESIKLSATVSPTDATTKTVTWSSSNTKVATVSSSGTVTAVGPGSAVITATTLDGGFIATCQITVNQPLKSIKFSSSSETYYVGQKKALKVVFDPTNATNKGVSFSSSKTSVATVDSSGNVTAKAVGSCTITAVSSDGGKKATCTVKVVKKVDVKEIYLSKNSVSVNSGKTYQLTVSFNPSNASNKSVKWTTSDKDVATVSSSGVVTGHKGGTATIKCTSSDTGVSDTCKVTVIEKPTKIELSVSSLTINVDKSKTISAEVLPSSATDKSIKWSSTDTSVAKVNSNGKITAVGGGVCDIVAKSNADSSVTARCRVTVLLTPKKITISETDLEIVKGDRAILSATVSPAGSYDMSVNWSSSKPGVAKVSSTGVVTAVSAGTAVITCSSVVDPSIKKTCNVTVYQPVTGVTLSAEKLTLTTGRTKTLVTTVLPAKASNKKVTYTTSNKNVVKVNSKGKVEAMGPGKATVTVRTSDGFYTAKCEITVIEPVVSVKLNKKSTTIAIGSTKTLTATVKPNNATNKNVTWRSSNPLVARVTQSGKVTAMAEGTATITCTTEDGAFKATCKVTCVIPVDAVSLNVTSVTLKNGKTKTVKAKIYPTDATIKDVKWTSSNKKVAKVDKNGKITAVGKGTCVITCTTKQGSKKATCKVKVK